MANSVRCKVLHRVSSQDICYCNKTDLLMMLSFPDNLLFYLLIIQFTKNNESLSVDVRKKIKFNLCTIIITLKLSLVLFKLLTIN